jgi:predicted dehydrogenase
VIDASYNVHASRSPKLEIFGRRGVIDLYSPDGPNVEIYRTDIAEGLDGWLSPVDWEASSDARRDQLGRAIMVEHLADCIREKLPNALTGEHARHALEIMLAVFQSADEGRTIDLTTSF